MSTSLNPQRLRDIQTLNVVKAILLTIFTFGLYYFFWQNNQFKQLNGLLENQEHSFFKWLILSILTFGIYHLYHEYKMSQSIIEAQKRFGLKESNELFPLICLIISTFGFFLIVDFVHQEELNKIILSLKQREGL